MKNARFWNSTPCIGLSVEIATSIIRIDESSVLTMKYPLKCQCTFTAKPGVTLHNVEVFLVITRKIPHIAIKRRGASELVFYVNNK